MILRNNLKEHLAVEEVVSSAVQQSETPVPRESEKEELNAATSKTRILKMPGVPYRIVPTLGQIHWRTSNHRIWSFQSKNQRQHASLHPQEPRPRVVAAWAQTDVQGQDLEHHLVAFSLISPHIRHPSGIQAPLGHQLHLHKHHHFHRKGNPPHLLKERHPKRCPRKHCRLRR